MTNAVVLLSGGLDSMVCAALAREAGFGVVALTVDYGQRHRVELESAAAIASRLADRHVVLPLDLRAFGGSALTSEIDVPKDGVGEGIPVTYVPARNTIFLCLALALAEASDARDIVIGDNAVGTRQRLRVARVRSLRADGRLPSLQRHRAAGEPRTVEGHRSSPAARPEIVPGAPRT